MDADGVCTARPRIGRPSLGVCRLCPHKPPDWPPPPVPMTPNEMAVQAAIARQALAMGKTCCGG